MEYVQEHAAVKGPMDGTPDDQTDAERKAVKLAEHLFQKSKRARSKFDKEWPTYFKYFMGDQWKHKRPTYRHSESLNIITANIRNIVPILTDPQPNVQTTPEDPTDFEFSEIINQVLSGKWDRDNFNMILAEAIVDACVCGTAIGYIPWLEEECDGLGDYGFETVDIANVYPDPSSRDMNDRRGQYLVLAEPVDVSELRKEYPDKKDKIKPDLQDAAAFNSYTDEAQEFSFQSPIDNRMMVADSRSVISGNPDLCLKLTAYIKSDEVVTNKSQVSDPQTGEVTEYEEHVKKYPNGRKIVTACGQLLEDIENPYEDGDFPYARLVNDVIPRSFWGEGEIKPQMSPQNITNKLISYLLDYLIIMGNPVWVIDSEAQVDTDNITNEPGMIVVKKKGGDARREQGVPPPPFIMNTLQYMVGDIFAKISGQNEISQGALDKSQLSGEAISQLTEASQTRLRAKARNIDAFLNQVGQLQFSRIMQYYNVPRVVRITGKDGSQQYFKFMVEKQPTTDESGQVTHQSVATYSEYQQGQEGMGGQFATPKQVPLKSSLDVRMSTGTALPFMKAKRDKQATDLFNMGILDAEDFLDTIEYPNKERIIEKWKQRQLMAQQQPPGSPPPPPGAGGVPPVG